MELDDTSRRCSVWMDLSPAEKTGILVCDQALVFPRNGAELRPGEAVSVVRRGHGFAAVVVRDGKPQSIGTVQEFRASRAAIQTSAPWRNA